MHVAVKVGLGIVAGAAILAGGALAALVAKQPESRPPFAEKVEPTAERLARGKYVVEHLGGCIGCHSQRDWTRFGGPIVPGSEGAGGEVFDAKVGVPGVVCAQNITPDPTTGKGSWTDGEIARAIREGVSRDGHALFPMMPYEFFRAMSDEDVRAAVAYLRTLKPIARATPAPQIDFPVNLFIKFAPKPIAAPIVTPDDAKDHLAYGKYVTTVAGCLECHTPHDAQNQRIAGREGAGGWKLRGAWGTVVTANITPHPKTFVGAATKEAFIARFKLYAKPDQEKAPAGRNSVMPWLELAGLTERDLGAIYDWLKTLPPVDNEVNAFPDAR
jgi:mono/diheme cytochrome c family protein